MDFITIRKEMDFTDLQSNCWSGAVDTLETIYNADKEADLMNLLYDVFGEENPTLTEVNDFLWFDDEYIFETLGINPDDDDDDDDDE